MKLSNLVFTKEMFIESAQWNKVNEERIQYHTQRLFGDKDVVSLRELDSYMIMNYGVTLEDVHNMTKEDVEKYWEDFDDAEDA